MLEFNLFSLKKKLSDYLTSLLIRSTQYDMRKGSAFKTIKERLERWLSGLRMLASAGYGVCTFNPSAGAQREVKLCELKVSLV